MKQSAKLYAETFLEQQSFEAFASSAGLRWDGVFFEQHKDMDPGEVLMPPAPEHRISIQLPSQYPRCEETRKVNWCWDRRRYEGPTYPGQISILGRGTPAYWQWTGKPSSIHVSLSHRLLEAAAVHGGFASAGLEIIGEVSTTNDEIHRLMALLASEVNNGGLHGRLFAEVVGQAMASTLLRQHSNRTSRICVRRRILTSVVLDRTLEYLHANYYLDIGLADLAKIAQISKFYFARMFKNTTGYSPHQFLIVLRIRKAQDYLIRYKDSTLSDTAVSVGFSDQSHFCRHFKSVVGETPLRWRSRVQS
jgi:AraC family transcriptional regulator